MNLFYRYDYFLIWGNGIQYDSQIIDIISENPKLEIVKIIKYTPPNGIEEFVKKIYSFDYAPFEHLREKTRYLMTTQCLVEILFVKNYDPDEEWRGTGDFRHLESITIREIKNYIRDLFNERKDDRRTENHVIHASDNEAQTEYLLKMLGYSGIEVLYNQMSSFDIPSHISLSNSFRIKKVRIDSLFVTVNTSEGKKILPLNESIHYKAVKNDDYKDYEQYICTYRGTLLRDYYSVKKFKNLAKFLTYENYISGGKYVVVEKYNDGFIIVDGFHRAAVLANNARCKELLVLEIK